MAQTMKIEIATPNHATGEWTYVALGLPASDTEIQDALHRARIMDSETYREYRIYGCNYFPTLPDNRLDTTSIEELNFLAQRLDSLNETECKILKAVTPRVLKNVNEGDIVSVKDLINLTYGLGKVSVASNVYDFVGLGELVIESEAFKWIENIPEDVRQFLDRYKVGQQYHADDDGAFIEGMYIAAGEYEFKEIYDGEELPIEGISIPIKETAFRLEVTRPPKDNEEASAVEKYARWIGLPIEKETANEIAQSLGMEKIEDCVYLDFESNAPQIEGDNFGDMHDFDKLNCLAEMMVQMSPSDQVKFKAVLSAEEPARIEEILDVARNLDRYEIATQIEYPYQFFKSYMERHMDKSVDPKWLDSLQMRQEGNELLGRLGAKQTPYGVISARNKGLYEPISRYESQIMDEQYELIEINGQKALFANEMIRDGDVPNGLYKYDLRGGSSRDFLTIEQRVMVDRSGTILVKKPFDFDGKDHIRLDEENSPNFLGEEATPREFMETDYEQEESNEIRLKMGGI